MVKVSKIIQEIYDAEEKYGSLVISSAERIKKKKLQRKNKKI